MEWKVVLGPQQTTLGNNRGPCVGQFGLQRAIRRWCAPSWFSVSDGRILDDQMPWFWSCAQMEQIVETHERGRPFIIGPNVLFGDSRKPGESSGERTILDSPHCRLIFTESVWYADLIKRHLGKESKAQICIVPYPVLPHPSFAYAERQAPSIDVLIYAKSGYDSRLLNTVIGLFPKTRVFIYGLYDRWELIDSAFRSKCCAFLSNDDRGPIAAAEILLTGCPIIATERGCPWVREIYGVGYEITSFASSTGDYEPAVAAIATAMNIHVNHDHVRQRAELFFSPQRILPVIFNHLERARSC